MFDDPDIWRAANLLVKRYGTDAALNAARRADELLAPGDCRGLCDLEADTRGVAELTRTTPAEGERVN